MIFFVIILFNFFFLFFHDFIAKKISLYDHPDNKRKIHINKVPLTGGFLFLLNIIIYLLFYFVIKDTSPNIFFGFKDLVPTLVFVLSIILLFIIGYIDDKIKLSVKFRLIFFIIIVLINLIINPELNIFQIRLSFLNLFFIGNYSYFWTLLCILLFINAFNFFDGINLQSSGLILAISTFFVFKNIYTEFFLVIILANFFFSYLNYSSKSFLGNNGSYFMPFLLGGLSISAYNNYPEIYADEIVMLMLVPGLDLVRLFLQRIINKKNPFYPDKNHLHHYLIRSYSNNKSAIITQLLIWVPFLLSQLYGYLFLFILIQIFIYFFLIFKYKN
jgi:UDP-GlcNAc:undecaprenyl-phosphate GlcNAc-1-phosphate transferase